MKLIYLTDIDKAHFKISEYIKAFTFHLRRPITSPLMLICNLVLAPSKSPVSTYTKKEMI